MHFARRGFTLTELLVILAILSVLAGLLFPVFLRAKADARKAGCLSNFHEAGLAAGLYGQDYDDVFMPVNHQLQGEPDPVRDRTWVQLLLPYAGSFNVFFCPESEPPERLLASPDPDAVSGDTDARYYRASRHVNTGYNYQYLAPIVQRDGAWVSAPRSASDISQPSSTILFVDSAGPMEEGQTRRSGSWLVVPPCRFESTGRDSIADAAGGAEVYSISVGWQSRPDSPFPYGGVWPWHSGQATVLNVDGSVRSLSPARMGAGCDVRESWRGHILDSGLYVWDAR